MLVPRAMLGRYLALLMQTWRRTLCSNQIGEFVHEIEGVSVYTKGYEEIHQLLLAGQSFRCCRRSLALFSCVCHHCYCCQCHVAMFFLLVVMVPSASDLEVTCCMMICIISMSSGWGEYQLCGVRSSNKDFRRHPLQPRYLSQSYNLIYD